jgi:BirA family biotin operon repressor/biotin-[acetyl-CoA-carboxylase] ligase
MELRHRIIHLLADGRFHSGEELARVYGISRAAVWKHIQILKGWLQMDIHSVRGRGYRLERALELLAEEEILAAMTAEGRSRLQQLELHHDIDSTNGYLLERSLDGGASGHACLAERQSAGRGRRGRRWVSPYGSSIYLSILWRFPVGPAQLGGLSLAAGLTVARCLADLGFEGIGLKWPNDVLCNGRKLAGLLLEVAGEAEGPSRVVLGLGLNVALGEREGKEIDQPWIDLKRLAADRELSRNRLAGQLLSNLLDTLARYQQEGLDPWVGDWPHFDLYHGKPVTLTMGERKIEGIHRGIDSSGALLLEHQGEITSYHGGEVSLRPVADQ